MILEAVFADRDGVINEEVEFLSDPADLRLIPNAAKAIRALNEKKIPVIVVTNQSGIARGYYSESEVDVLHEALSNELLKNGAHIDRFYYCPHHKDGKGKYAIDCNCRKPLPGMLQKVAKDFNLDLSKCAMVGDKASDIGAGNAVGCQTVLVMTGYGKKNWSSWKETFRPSFIAQDLSEAVSWLLKESAI